MNKFKAIPNGIAINTNTVFFELNIQENLLENIDEDTK